MPDENNAPDLNAKFEELDSRLNELSQRYQAAIDEEEDDEPVSDVKALRKRLSDVTAKRREMIGDLRNLGSEINGVKKQYTEAISAHQQLLQEALTAKEQEFQTQLQRVSGMHSEDLTLSDHGIKDPLGRTAVRQAWEALPQDKRPESAAAWWAEKLEGLARHREDPDNVPAPAVPLTLVGYLPGDGKRTVEPVNTETKRAPTKKGPVTAADIANAKTMQEYNELMSRMREQQRKG